MLCWLPKWWALTQSQTPIYGALIICWRVGSSVWMFWATADDVASHIRPDTAMILCETPANPTLALIDIEDIVRQAGDILFWLILHLRPYLTKAFTTWCNTGLHSGTKFLWSWRRDGWYRILFRRTGCRLRQVVS